MNSLFLHLVQKSKFWVVGAGRPGFGYLDEDRDKTAGSL